MLSVPDNLPYAGRLLAGLRTRDWCHLCGLTAALAAAPLVTLYVIQYLVDFVAERPDGDTTPWTSGLLLPIVLFFAVSAIADSAETLQYLKISLLRDEVALEIERRHVVKTLSHHDLSIADDRDLKALQTLARDATSSGQFLVQLVTNLSTGVLLVIPTIFIVAGIAWWIPLIVLATAIPATLMQLHYERKAWDVEQRHVSLNNRAQAMRASMLDTRSATDLRTYLMHVTLLPKWIADAATLLRLRRDVATRGAHLVLALAVVSGAGLLVPYVYVIEKALTGQASVGTLALFIGLIPELRRGLFIVFGSASEVVGAAAKIDGLREFDATRPRIELAPEVIVDRSREVRGSAPTVELIDVSFAYSVDSGDAVHGVSLVLPAATSTLIVGVNGAGKSTVGKLVGRLYDPTGGAVLIDDVDLRAIPVVQHRQRTAFLAQDPARLPLSIRDCLALGDAHVSDIDLIEVLHRVGLHRKVTELKDGLDTQLSTTLAAGVELSGGQWQRLAIARLLLALPKRSLAIVDEPTTSLDPIADRRLSDEMLNSCRGITSIFVSHRLHIAPQVDRVVVMDAGRIVAQGAHAELLVSSAAYRQILEADR